ncbi:MAG: hypothetical protein Q8O41_09860 [Candidatus Methanoperedens sp.]|nr:hypothetical protein [Candidatus Methanoperedens sp.]
MPPEDGADGIDRIYYDTINIKLPAPIRHQSNHFSSTNPVQDALNCISGISSTAHKT